MMQNKSLSAVQVEYQRGISVGKQLALDAALEAITAIKLQKNGTYKLGNTGYSNPLDAVEDVLINLRKSKA
jgi:hypothetical protein